MAALAESYEYNHSDPRAGTPSGDLRSWSLATRGCCETERKASCGQVQELPIMRRLLQLRPGRNAASCEITSKGGRLALQTR